MALTFDPWLKFNTVQPLILGIYCVHNVPSTFIYGDLDLWPLTFKLNRVHPLVMVLHVWWRFTTRFSFLPVHVHKVKVWLMDRQTDRTTGVFVYPLYNAYYKILKLIAVVKKHRIRATCLLFPSLGNVPNLIILQNVDKNYYLYIRSCILPYFSQARTQKTKFPTSWRCKDGLKERDKLSDIEQQPPFGNCKYSKTLPQKRGGGIQNQQEHII